MGKLVLLLVAAAWAAVLIPPLLRSRIENRPNNSVSDFRNQLSSLQKAVPSRTVQMRAMARPLVSSPLERPAAAGRPGDGRTMRRHGGSFGAQGAAQATASRRAHHDRDLSGRRHRNDRQRAHHRPARELSPRDAQKRRRANVLFVLVLVTACSLFLALTTEVTAVTYVFALSFLALASYVYMLGQSRQRDAAQPAPRSSAPRHRERWLDVA